MEILAWLYDFTRYNGVNWRSMQRYNKVGSKFACKLHRVRGLSTNFKANLAANEMSGLAKVNLLNLVK